MREILLVEDNPADAYLTCDALARSGQPCHVTVVTDGAKAITSLRENCGTAMSPDMMILDLNLPLKDGRALLAEVKADPRLCRTPVVVFTASQAAADLKRSYELGANCYIRKPGNITDFVAVVQAIGKFWLALSEKMTERREAERRDEQEMQIARQVQSRLLPQQAPALATLDCAGKCIQTRAVGGDYYDFLDFGSGKLGLVLADISGKGVSGALLMANLQANLRSHCAVALEDLSGLLRSVNHLFYANTETNNYATTFFAIYDDETRILRYVNCGHNPPLLLRQGGDVERLEATASVLGLFEQWECSVAERRLAAGDVLIIYTDGISEAVPGEQAEEFGDQRLIQTVRAHQLKSAGEMLEAIVAEVQHFSQGEQADDMTLIVTRSR